jgi:hypothetical protein
MELAHVVWAPLALVRPVLVSLALPAELVVAAGSALVVAPVQ